MNLLFICPARSAFDVATDRGRLGGVELCNVELAGALAGLSHRLTLMTPSGATIERDGVINHPLGPEHETIPGDYDVAISSNDVRPLLRARAKAHVLWLHNPLQIEKAARRRQLFPLWHLRPHGVFVGRVLEETTTRLFRFASRSVIPHGIQTLFHDAGPVAGGREPVFVWASQPQRGLRETLDTWIRLVSPSAPQARFHVFGSHDRDMQYDKATLDACGVRFFPRVSREELIAHYRRSLAMIYPGAHDETFCLAAVEANALGLPIITLGRGSLIERVQHGVNGFVARDDADVARWALALLQSQRLRDLLFDGAVNSAKPYRWERSAALWEQRLSSLLVQMRPGGVP